MRLRPSYWLSDWTAAEDVGSGQGSLTPSFKGDVTGLRSLPKTDLLSAGFPCTDLSQAGRTAGIVGEASGLVSYVFDLLKSADPTWLVFENVRQHAGTGP